MRKSIAGSGSVSARCNRSGLKDLRFSVQNFKTFLSDSNTWSPTPDGRQRSRIQNHPKRSGANVYQQLRVLAGRAAAEGLAALRAWDHRRGFGNHRDGPASDTPAGALCRLARRFPGRLALAGCGERSASICSLVHLPGLDSGCLFRVHGSPCSTGKLTQPSARIFTRARAASGTVPPHGVFSFVVCAAQRGAARPEYREISSAGARLCIYSGCAALSLWRQDRAENGTGFGRAIESFRLLFVLPF